MAHHVTDRTTFGANMSLDDAQVVANWMSVTPGYFADASCEGDRVFGLWTSCSNNCEKDDCDCAIMLNPCVRRVMWRYLHMIQQATEAHLGWCLTERFVSETLPYSTTDVYLLRYGGLLEGCVGLEVVDPELADVAYHYALMTNIMGVDDGDGRTEVRLDMSIVDNPQKIMFFRSDSGNGITPSESKRVRIDGTEWVVSFEQGYLPPGVAVDVVHCELGYVDVTYANDGACPWELVYPNSIQKIPIFKEETLTGDVVRYWVRHRDMINPAFTLEPVNLEMGEFWKLHQTVSFMQFCEVQRLATIYCQKAPCSGDAPCTLTEVPACCTVINGELGAIGITPVSYITDPTQGTPVYDTDGVTVLYVTDDDGNILFEEFDYCKNPCWNPLQVEIHYKVGPYLYEAAVEEIRRAIAAKVAAEVPFIDCGCSNKEFGFFKEMRVDMSSEKTNAIGEVTILYEYGKLYGQMEYANTVFSRHIPVHIRPVVIPG